jgi:hypothetical protein
MSRSRSVAQQAGRALWLEEISSSAVTGSKPPCAACRRTVSLVRRQVDAVELVVGDIGSGPNWMRGPMARSTEHDFWEIACTSSRDRALAEPRALM